MKADDSPGPILCVGRVYCDVIFTELPRMPTLGSEVFAGKLGLHAGGGAFTTAAHLVALGRPAVLAATLPRHPFDAPILADMARAGLDAGACVPGDETDDPQITVVMATRSDRAFLTRRTGRAAPPLSVEDLRRLRPSLLHVGELVTLVENPELLDLAEACGVPVSVDCGWEDDLDPDAIARLAGRVAIFLPNEAEAARLDGLGLLDGFAPLIVTKCGRNGSRAVQGERRVSAPAIDVVPVDTTGAGDAFNAGFLDRWQAGAALELCLQAGNELGARATLAPGGIGCLDLPVVADTVGARLAR